MSYRFGKKRDNFSDELLNQQLTNKMNLASTVQTAVRKGDVATAELILNLPPNDPNTEVYNQMKELQKKDLDEKREEYKVNNKLHHLLMSLQPNEMPDVLTSNGTVLNQGAQSSNIAGVLSGLNLEQKNYLLSNLREFDVGIQKYAKKNKMTPAEIEAFIDYGINKLVGQAGIGHVPVAQQEPVDEDSEDNFPESDNEQEVSNNDSYSDIDHIEEPQSELGDDYYFHHNNQYDRINDERDRRRTEEDSSLEQQLLEQYDNQYVPINPHNHHQLEYEHDHYTGPDHDVVNVVSDDEGFNDISSNIKVQNLQELKDEVKHYEAERIKRRDFSNQMSDVYSKYCAEMNKKYGDGYYDLMNPQEKGKFRELHSNMEDAHRNIDRATGILAVLKNDIHELQETEQNTHQSSRDTKIRQMELRLRELEMLIPELGNSNTKNARVRRYQSEYESLQASLQAELFNQKFVPSTPTHTDIDINHNRDPMDSSFNPTVATHEIKDNTKTKTKDKTVTSNPITNEELEMKHNRDLQLDKQLEQDVENNPRNESLEQRIERVKGMATGQIKSPPHHSKPSPHTKIPEQIIPQNLHQHIPDLEPVAEIEEVNAQQQPQVEQLISEPNEGKIQIGKESYTYNQLIDLTDSKRNKIPKSDLEIICQHFEIPMSQHDTKKILESKLNKFVAETKQNLTQHIVHKVGKENLQKISLGDDEQAGRTYDVKTKSGKVYNINRVMKDFTRDQIKSNFSKPEIQKLCKYNEIRIRKTDGVETMLEKLYSDITDIKLKATQKGYGLKKIPFGKFNIDRKKLRNNILSVRRENGRGINEYPDGNISDNMKKMFMDQNFHGHLTLTEGEKKVFKDLHRRAGKDIHTLPKKKRDVLEIGTISQSNNNPPKLTELFMNDDDLKNRYDVVSGMINANNNSPILRQELSQIIPIMVQKGLITKQKGGEILKRYLEK